MNDIFSRESDKLVRDHVNEFLLNDSNMMIHLACGWNYTSAFNPPSPWGLRAVMLGHLRRKHQ